MAETGGLADLSDLMALYEDKIVPYKLSLGTYDGKIYSVPWDGSPAVLYYRRNIFEEHGIDPELILLYDDFLAVGMKLKEESDGQIKLWNLGKDSWFPIVNFAQQGSGLFNLEETDVIIDDPEGVCALTFLKTLWDEELVHQNIGSEAAIDTYKDGTTAAFLQPSGGSIRLRDRYRRLALSVGSCAYLLGKRAAAGR